MTIQAFRFAPCPQQLALVLLEDTVSSFFFASHHCQVSGFRFPSISKDMLKSSIFVLTEVRKNMIDRLFLSTSHTTHLASSLVSSLFQLLPLGMKIIVTALHFQALPF